MTQQYRSEVMASIHETAEGLHAAGVMNTQTMQTRRSMPNAGWGLWRLRKSAATIGRDAQIADEAGQGGHTRTRVACFVLSNLGFRTVYQSPLAQRSARVSDAM
jgi:hypothetical protein